MARKQAVSPPEAGSEAPEFVLPAAQGGQLHLSRRTVRGPVAVVFYRGSWSEECVEYFKALAEREREINVAGATLAGVGAVEPGEAREFVRLTGFKSYILYDYVRTTTREYGLLRKDTDHGDTARPAAFLIGSDHEVLRAWLDERPDPADLLAEVSGITGLPKEPEEEGEEKPKKRPRKSAETADGEASAEADAEAGAGTEEAGSGEAAGAGEPSPEEREKRRAGRKAAGSGTPAEGTEASGPEAESGDDPPRQSGEAAADPGESRNSAEASGAETQEDDGPARDEDR